MGSSTSRFLGDVGSVIGGVVAIPFKIIFGRSCQEVCVGVWDVVCFIEHICVGDLVKFLLICCLSYLCLFFLFLLYRLGICQCVIKVVFNMCWIACETSWLALDYVCCYCWYKIRYTKRVYRGRQRHLQRQLSRDVELGYMNATSTSSDGRIKSVLNCHSSSSLIRKRKLRSEITRRRNMNHGKSVRLKKGQVSIRFKGGSHRRRSRSRRQNHLERPSLRIVRRTNTASFKKQRIS